MGLFSSKSKSSSSSKTTYTDNSKKINVDLSKGDSLAGGAGENQTIVAGGNVTYNGMSDSLAKSIFGTLTNTVKQTFETSLNWVSDAIGKQNEETKQYLKDQSETVDQFMETQRAANTQTVQALQMAYNSEQATITSLKSYALYGMIAFVAWAYFGRRK